MNSLIDLWEFASKLKTEPRKGWTRKLGLQRTESVADHSFALSLLCMFEAQRRSYNIEQTLKLAIIHDIEEAVTGDLTPEDKKTKGKHIFEHERNSARDKLLHYIPRGNQQEYRELWSELDEGKTKEARLVHELDKIEMALQAKAYSRKEIKPDKLHEFFESAKKAVKDPELRKLLSEISPEQR